MNEFSYIRCVYCEYKYRIYLEDCPNCKDQRRRKQKEMKENNITPELIETIYSDEKEDR